MDRAGHVYVSTKLAAEMLVHSYREMYGQEFTILRYGIPYGPRMRDALVVARFVRAAVEGSPIIIAGTGEQQRSYVYVEDLADAHVRALTPAAANQTLALEGGTPVSVREIADVVCSLVRPVPVRHTEAARRTSRAWPSPTSWPRNCWTGRRSRRSRRASAGTWAGSAS